MWQADDVRKLRMTLTVESADAKAVKLRLDGAALLATGPDPDEAKRGYDAALLGYIEYDRAKDRIARFDVIATGDHWGGAATPAAPPRPQADGRRLRARPGRQARRRGTPTGGAGAGSVFRREVRPAAVHIPVSGS